MYFLRRFLLCLLLCSAGWVLFESPAKASISLNVMWIASSDTNVVGYKIYYGTVSRQYTNVIVAGNVTSISISGIELGNTYYFAATSYNAAGWESSYSPEISYTVPVVNAAQVSIASTSGGIKISVNGMAASPYVIMASTNLINWVALATNTSPFVFTDTGSSNYSRRFYQAVQGSAL
ncbi:MAG TPA: fibronectin type III domain-containing protein [Candidatus Angelobacter sp.]|jgi:hypothetical protein|nr:fibronectin type III domain-containing protein [Candidatus Angelobacter sp.]